MDAVDPAADPAPDRTADRALGHAADRTFDRAADRAFDRAPDRAGGRTPFGPRVRVASAPVSFGVYDAESASIAPDDMLATMRAAGYAGTDSGPVGYLGTGAELADRLARHGLALAGGWVDLRYGDARGFAEDLAGLEAALDVFAGVPVDDPRFAPRPTLACPADPARFARPGAPVDRALQLAPDVWPGFAARVREAAARCRDRGLEPVFHHHLGTDVETEEEVERLLDLADVSLCLDTGHLWLAGGDPVAAIARWSGRIRQVHVKDASRDTLARVRAAGGDLWDAVRGGVFPPLGGGDLDLDAVVGALARTGYEGWVVVEQDVPATGPDLGRVAADQVANRERLARAGLVGGPPTAPSAPRGRG
ncbi:sugar phosphate isomerase/epimerase family protein [Microtetraspora niveoalba]|uniref:sugar phosphate isomerase/epimerase family protein n=1 Tax=Microtetraspora niveoalba TaxID=46175 RepID=UPI000A576B1E|nr:sugar phosphate isomerase/epimerase [Microtetraspora niveoalba]